jgi:hypothetical protein
MRTGGVLRLLSSAAVLTVLFSFGNAQRNPFLGKDQFPQFRQLSGLSGGGYGLDANGWGSLSGAVAFSTPLGYALGHDQFRLGLGETSFSSGNISAHETTGKAFVTYGHSFGDVNVAYSYFVKSKFGDASSDLQLSYAPKNASNPGFSVGVQDIKGSGGAAGTFIPGDKDLSRSLFAAATFSVPVGSTPLYFSGGWGTRRFDKGFASASYQLASPLRLWTEYDGWGFNEGVLLAMRPNGLDSEGQPKHAFEADLLLGMIRGRFPTASLTIGF